jgi:CO dehydrogenase maturation factor
VETIKNVAKELVMYDEIGLIVNRAPLPEKLKEMKEGIGGVPIVSVISQDNSMTENDIEGKSIFELPEDALILQGAREALTTMGIL